MATTLHHFAYNIKSNQLELVLEMFEILGCTIAYREKDKRWCLVEQKPIPIDIQIIETEDSKVPIKAKINTHIAFLSDSPKEDIDKIEEWIDDQQPGNMSKKGRQYYILDGKRRETSEFNQDWIQNNCNLEKQVVW